MTDEQQKELLKLFLSKWTGIIPVELQKAFREDAENLIK